MKNILGAVSIVLIIVLVTSCLPFSDCESNDSFTVTDNLGHTCTFNGPVEKIVSIGKGPTATTIELGCLDKIVVTDSYSATSSESVFDSLKNYVKEGKISAGGNMYSSIEQLKTEIIDAADSGKFDKINDAIIITGGGVDATKTLCDYLKLNGFSRVLGWVEAKSYSEVIYFTQCLSRILTGDVTEDVAKMSIMEDYISQTLLEAGISESNAVECFAIRFSSSNWQVSNYGSLATSMLETAGGIVVTKDEQKSEAYYPIEHPSTIIEEYGTDTVIFTDSTINGETMNKLRIEVGNAVKICTMEPLWNNYGLDSMNGVWTMACAMYPDLFQGDVPVVPSNEIDLFPYACAAVVAVIIISALGVYFLRYKK